MAKAILTTPSSVVNSIEICTNNINQTEIPIEDLYDSIKIIVRYIITKKEGRRNMKNDTQKQILKNTSLVAVEAVAASVSPYLLLAFNFSKSMYGIGLQLRHQKVLEWVEMVRDNPDLFTEKVLESQSFQDGFVYALEEYIKERSDAKRQYYQNIFKNFAQSNERDEFELERFYNSVVLLGNSGAEALKSVQRNNSGPYQVYDDEDNIEGVYNLIQTGVLVFDTTARFSGEGFTAPFVRTTHYGARFIKYLNV